MSNVTEYIRYDKLVTGFTSNCSYWAWKCQLYLFAHPEILAFSSISAFFSGIFCSHESIL